MSCLVSAGNNTREWNKRTAAAAYGDVFGKWSVSVDKRVDGVAFFNDCCENLKGLVVSVE